LKSNILIRSLDRSSKCLFTNSKKIYRAASVIPENNGGITLPVIRCVDRYLDTITNTNLMENLNFTVLFKVSN